MSLEEAATEYAKVQRDFPMPNWEDLAPDEQRAWQLAFQTAV